MVIERILQNKLAKCSVCNNKKRDFYEILLIRKNNKVLNINICSNCSNIEKMVSENFNCLNFDNKQLVFFKC